MPQLARAWAMGGSRVQKPSRGSYASTAAILVRVFVMPPTTYSRPAAGRNSTAASATCEMLRDWERCTVHSGLPGSVKLSRSLSCSRSLSLWQDRVPGGRCVQHLQLLMQRCSPHAGFEAHLAGACTCKGAAGGVLALGLHVVRQQHEPAAGAIQLLDGRVHRLAALAADDKHRLLLKRPQPACSCTR